MPALEQVRGVIRALQTSVMVLSAEIVSNINLITLTVLPKRLFLDAWLGLGSASKDWYCEFLTIQTKICKDGRRSNINGRQMVKIESF